LHHLVTVLGPDGMIRAWPLWWGSSAAWHGPQLLEMLPGAGFHALELGRIPESGVHVDVPGKALGVWLTNPDPGLFRWLGKLWPGWRIERWDDRFEEHFRRCGPGITAPELDLTSGVVEAEAWLRKRVFQSYEDSPAGCVSTLAALFGSLELHRIRGWGKDAGLLDSGVSALRDQAMSELFDLMAVERGVDGYVCASNFADVVEKLGLIDDVDGDVTVRVVPEDAGYAVEQVLTAAVAVDLAEYAGWATGTDPGTHIAAVQAVLDAGATPFMHFGQCDPAVAIDFYRTQVLPKLH
jgi:hypothetical protein